MVEVTWDPEDMERAALHRYALIKPPKPRLIERGLGGMSVRAWRSIITAYLVALIRSSPSLCTLPSLLW